MLKKIFAKRFFLDRMVQHLIRLGIVNERTLLQFIRRSAMKSGPVDGYALAYISFEDLSGLTFEFNYRLIPWAQEWTAKIWVRIPFAGILEQRIPVVQLYPSDIG